MKLFLISSFLIILSGSLLSETIITSSGKINAKKHKSVYLYEDIPYAKPPIGILRWKAPKEILSNEVILPKKDNFCIQRPSNLGGANGEKAYVGSEDCLYLDVFTPTVEANQKIPVMFWIHGGGNTSGLKDLYDFSKMVKKYNVIVVRVNYRLGPFGWFTHPAIQSFQQGEDKTSNFGTLDLVMALKWVKNNISILGGDPNNVTIFGESAGGHNVLSLLVATKAKGLFHKAISMSGYTTSISIQDAFKPKIESSTSNYSSSMVVKKLLEKYDIDSFSGDSLNEKTREMLLTLSTEDFFQIYIDRKSYEEIPLMTADEVVIPKVGLSNALSMNEYVNNVPTIAGSNRDEVKLWLATARYFVDLEYSLIGSVLRIPKVKLNNDASFEAFNYYRSSAWKIRGVENPLRSLSKAGNKNLYAYRYDWDDHRRLVVADFKKLIGAAHATEIPLLTGNSDLVGGYPLSDLIYPPSFSKRYTSKNMMQYWTNFAKTGSPGESTNSVLWEPYSFQDGRSNFLILDKKKHLKMVSEKLTFKSLSVQLAEDSRVNELEKCVILLQMFTYVGNDLYDINIENYPNECARELSEQFLKDNASFIEY
ncbi:carboxylesterase family protein [Gammaproteobacteria bacterium]|nr:carboxylesterase family protein [Gammaproteobacteria bacterium]